jgi:Holliday junction resolvase RusA-like endonuclease
MTANGPVFFKNKKGAEAVETYAALLSPYRPKKPLEGTVSLEVAFVWPWRKADLATKQKRVLAERYGSLWHGNKPDADNAIKLLLDVLVMMRFIEDDQRVVDLRVSKLRGADPGIRIKILEVRDVEF